MSDFAHVYLLMIYNEKFDHSKQYSLQNSQVT